MADKRIPSLDGLRGVSILLVILGHLSYLLPKRIPRYFTLFIYSNVGVIIFFVISGFLITTLLLNEKSSHRGQVNVRLFYIRRFLRIVPVNFLYICVILLCNKVFSLGYARSSFWHAFTYTVNFLGAPWILGHLWSLSVEEQFYLFWPWVTRLSFKAITGFAVAIIVYAPLVRVIFYLYPNWQFITLAPFFRHADSLMIGCLLAISRHSWPELWKSPLLKNRILCLFSIFTIFSITFLSSISQLIRHHSGYLFVPLGTTIISLCAAYIIASTTTDKKNILYSFLNHPLICYIGILSYSIYIWQQAFLGEDYLPNTSLWRRVFPTNVLLVFCVSVLSYHIWEKGFLKLKDKFKAGSNL
ncbi:MAG TPA: acyltransferase [Candidatus Margulisiibacteriota bacterium]|nr:acyltransferase [Candidatus Margulisiibacteriota bacterium]